MSLECVFEDLLRQLESTANVANERKVWVNKLRSYRIHTNLFIRRIDAVVIVGIYNREDDEKKFAHFEVHHSYEMSKNQNLLFTLSHSHLSVIILRACMKMFPLFI